MKVSSVTRRPPLQEWADSAVPAMIRANVARLAQHSAERASGNRAPQALPFDGARTGVAKRARAFIDGYFGEPVRMEDLCRATGVGVRTLQRCFRQCFGVTVTSYLKAVRLDGAYRDLIAAHPSRDTVTTIALRNGYSHLGRFSSEFRERFGQLPRETLSSEPSAFGQLRGGPQPASPGQLMQRAAGSVEPPAGPTAVFGGSTRELLSHADRPAPATAQQGLEVLAAPKWCCTGSSTHHPGCDPRSQLQQDSKDRPLAGALWGRSPQDGRAARRLRRGLGYALRRDSRGPEHVQAVQGNSTTAGGRIMPTSIYILYTSFRWMRAA